MPISDLTRSRLTAPPAPGSTHLWLAQVAGGLRRHYSPDTVRCFLRRCCDLFVGHRTVPDREIDDAVHLAWESEGNHRVGMKWPAADERAAMELLEVTQPLFDGHSAVSVEAGTVLKSLFPPETLICYGPRKEVARIAPVEQLSNCACNAQFVVPNPMLGLSAISMSGRPSVRCQANVRERRYLVCEFDGPGLGKDRQAHLLSGLSLVLPLRLVVDSGSKSLHGWFDVKATDESERKRFFGLACLVGADPSRWDSCGWVRMPGGLRGDAAVADRVRQEVLYWKPVEQLKEELDG